MVFKLSVYLSGKLLDSKDFDKDVVNIGRSPDCDLVIDNLGISREHVQIERKSNVYVLRDLKSSNGVIVRGEAVQKHNLNSGDEFFIGKHSIIFSCEEQSSEVIEQIAPSVMEKKKEIDGRTMEVDAQELVKLQRKQEAIAAYLKVAEAGARRSLPIKKTATFFGTHSQCEYKLRGQSQKRHVMLLREETGFRLIHLGKQNPPKVNGADVDDKRLSEGDVIVVGNIKMIFHLGDP